MIEIKNTVSSDLRKLAECHKSAFPDSLSSKMGVKYITEMIAWYLSDSSKILFHAEEDSKCLGYCGGMVIDGTQQTGSASGMMQYSFNSAVTAIMLRPWLIFHKEFLNKYKLIIKNVKRKFKTIKKTNDTIKVKGKVNIIQNEKEMGLVVIGVSSEHHGKGIGTMLLKEFEIKTLNMNIHKMGLAVKSINSKALKSYQRNGWEISKEYDDYFEMTKRI